MKKSEIKAGVTYSNGKAGRFHGLRRVEALGPQFTLYDTQACRENLSYAIVKGQREPYPRGTTEDGLQVCHSTVASFAAWAKEIVPEDAPATA